MQPSSGISSSRAKSSAGGFATRSGSTTLSIGDTACPSATNSRKIRWCRTAARCSPQRTSVFSFSEAKRKSESGGRERLRALLRAARHPRHRPTANEQLDATAMELAVEVTTHVESDAPCCRRIEPADGGVLERRHHVGAIDTVSALRIDAVGALRLNPGERCAPQNVKLQPFAVGGGAKIDAPFGAPSSRCIRRSLGRTAPVGREADGADSDAVVGVDERAVAEHRLGITPLARIAHIPGSDDETRNVDDAIGLD